MSPTEETVCWINLSTYPCGTIKRGEGLLSTFDDVTREQSREFDGNTWCKTSVRVP